MYILAKRIAPVICLCLVQVGIRAEGNRQASELTSTTTCVLGDGSGFSIEETEHGVNVKVDGKPFASYVVDDINKPYLWPIYGPTGKPMTRAFPMQLQPNESAAQRDHPHHRGITFGHDRIVSRGSILDDTWHERMTFLDTRSGVGVRVTDAKRMANLAAIKHREFTELFADSDRAVVSQICDHVDSAGNRFLIEERRITFRSQVESRSIDVDQVFAACEDAVCFEDRKDAGLSIRVPASMAIDSEQGGHVVNSEGDMDDEAWGRSARWCDYHGPVDGQHLGIAFLSHPSSFRFPTRWHVRSYGLFAANPFAMRAFDDTLSDGATILEPGETLTLRHRIIFHVGDAKSAGIEKAWQEYRFTKTSIQ